MTTGTLAPTVLMPVTICCASPMSWPELVGNELFAIKEATGKADCVPNS